MVHEITNLLASFLLLVVAITEAIYVSDLQNQFQTKSKAQTQSAVTSTGAIGNPLSPQELDNIKKYNQLVSKLPIYQDTFYITYLPKLDRIVANLYLPNYSTAETNFKNWLITQGYGNLPQDYFYYNLTEITPTPKPSSTPTLKPTATSTPTPTPIGYTLNLKPIADTFVDKTNLKTNFGYQTTISADGSPVKITYLKFDLSPVSGKILKKVVFSFRVCSDPGCPSGGYYYLSSIPDVTWTESGLTFFNQPTAATTLVGTIPSTTPNQTVSININPSLLQGYTGKQFTLLIESSNSDELGIYSREYTAFPPTLSLTY